MLSALRARAGFDFKALSSVSGGRHVTENHMTKTSDYHSSTNASSKDHQVHPLLRQKVGEAIRSAMSFLNTCLFDDDQTVSKIACEDK